MSVLWVTGEVPDRAGGGGNIRQANLLPELARHVEVDLVVVGTLHDERVREASRRVIEVHQPETVEGGRARRRAAAVMNAWGRSRPLEVASAIPTLERLRPVVGQVAPDCDAVLVHHQALLPLLPRHRAQPWLAHLFHISADWSRQAAELAAGLQAALLRRDGRNAARLERWAVSAYDGLIVVSEEDRVRLGSPPNTAVVPHGVDLEAFRASAVPQSVEVLLAGSLDWRPNVEGSIWFATEVWPRILARVPGATLRVVGRRPWPEVRALAARPGIDVVADVPEMAPWFARCRVAVVPLRIGTGTRVKLQEAFASGRPVVGTRLGLEGHELGEGALVHDAPGPFADAVVRLLLDDEEAASRGAGARRVAESWPTWAVAGKAVATAVRAACEDRPAVP